MSSSLVIERNLINCRGRLLTLHQPLVMGILNLTPDSFSDGGSFNQLDSALRQTELMLSEGATIIDVGAYSSRPNAPHISVSEETERLKPILPELVKRFPNAVFSIDTFRSEVARFALEHGVHIVNDISAGHMDEKMLATVAEYQVPYVMMHLKGTPQTMQNNPHYEDVWEEIWHYFVERMNRVRSLGIYDIIIDPGIGFGKTPEHNLEILRRLNELTLLGYPILIGISRKSTIRKLAHEETEQMLPLTSALHLKALQDGAKILRVHDVRPARLAIELYNQLGTTK